MNPKQLQAYLQLSRSGHFSARVLRVSPVKKQWLVQKYRRPAEYGISGADPMVMEERNMFRKWQHGSQQRGSKSHGRALEMVAQHVLPKARLKALPVAIEGVLRRETVLINHGDSRGDDLRIGVHAEGFEDLLHFVWGPDIIIVREEKDVTCSVTDSVLKAGHNTTIAGVLNQANSAIVERAH